MSKQVKIFWFRIWWSTRSKTIREKLKDVGWIWSMVSDPAGRQRRMSFRECQRINNKFHKLQELPSAEYTDIIKKIGDVAPERGIKARSKDGNQ